MNVAVARDLIFQLVIEMAFKFADLAAAEAGYMDVIARAVSFVVVAVAAEMEKVEFVNETVFLQEIDGAVYGDQMDFRADFLRPLQDLIDIEMLLGVVHNLENYATLAGESNATQTQSVLKMARWVCGVDAFAGGDSVGG